MKAQLTGKKHEEGFTTLEILIAFTVLILCISAVIMISFGNQSIAVDSQINNEAISKAQALLEKARADSREDFNLVNPILPNTPPGNIYTENLDVTQTDLFTKKVTSTVSWQTGEKILSTIFTTLLTNPEAVDGGDTCSSVLTGDWSKPQIKNTTTDFLTLAGVSGMYPITSLDTYEDKLYVTTSNSSINQKTFFIFNINKLINNLPNPLIASIDNDSINNSGLNAIATNGNYAYVANASGVSVGQLQVIDLNTNPLNVVKNIKLPGGVGNSIFYKNGYIYLGLKTKAGAGPEFYIFDARSTPANPFQIGFWPPFGNLGHDINTILTKENYAYIVSPNSQELQILDISNQSIPTLTGGFSDGAGNGKDVYLVGNKLYFGKTTGTGDDFFILDNTNPASTLTKLGGVDIGVGNSIDGVIVRDYLSFLLTNKDLQIFNISDPLHITPWSTYSLPGTYSSSYPEPSIDCEGNRIFISSNNEGGQGSIYIIEPKSK